ncbi:MAG: hypothetical protein V4510_12305 [bacterium]
MTQRNVLASLLLAAALLAAGCTAPGGPGPTSTHPASPTSNASNATQPGPVAPPAPEMDVQFTTWNQCRMLVTSVSWEGSTSPAHPLASWGGTGGTGSESGIQFFDCQRFNWGPFERPLRFILEGHTNQTVPEQCKLGDWFFFASLNAIYVDDPQVVAYMASNLSLPARHASMTVTYGDTVHLVWQPDGGEQSEVSITALRLQNTTDDVKHRLAWAKEGRVTLLDWHESGDLAWPVFTPATGHMRPPMLNAKLGDPYVGNRGGFDGFTDDTEVEGHMYRFNDDQCKEPIDPYP